MKPHFSFRDAHFNDYLSDTSMLLWEYVGRNKRFHSFPVVKNIVVQSKFIERGDMNV